VGSFGGINKNMDEQQLFKIKELAREGKPWAINILNRIEARKQQVQEVKPDVEVKSQNINHILYGQNTNNVKQVEKVGRIVGIRLDDDLYQKLMQQKYLRCISLSAMIRMAILDYCELQDKVAELKLERSKMGVYNG
jgi:coenzyme F420-reducing hydrogenase alpha subunit